MVENKNPKRGEGGGGLCIGHFTQPAQNIRPNLAATEADKMKQPFRSLIPLKFQPELWSPYWITPSRCTEYFFSSKVMPSRASRDYK